jgi:hypothetical protein
MGLSAEEFYSMTWGNFNRQLLGHIRRAWVVNREIIAAIYSTATRKRVTGEDIFPFGAPQSPPEPPSKKDRELMKRIHEHRLKHGKR